MRLGEWDLRTNPDCEDVKYHDFISNWIEIEPFLLHVYVLFFQGECANPVLDVPVAETIVHENYVPQSPLQNNDIALIRLAQSVQFTDWIRPVCLPFSRTLRNKNYDNAPLVVAGFGKTENGMTISVLMNLWINHQVFFYTL